MPTLYMCPGLYAWTLELENGTTRYFLATSMHAAVTGILPDVPIRATRGPAVGLDPPIPYITALAPPSAKLGDPSFTLRVLGANFKAGDVILWNGAPEPTTMVGRELHTTINMATAEVAMPIPVTVLALTGLHSNTVNFDLHPADEPEGTGTARPWMSTDRTRGAGENL